jgi:hypothetical protein
MKRIDGMKLRDTFSTKGQPINPAPLILLTCTVKATSESGFPFVFFIHALELRTLIFQVQYIQFKTYFSRIILRS